MLDYHQGSKNLCVDLGTGHGIVARSFAGSFKNVVGVDPSAGMVEQARHMTEKQGITNTKYYQSSAENLAFLEDQSVDLVVAAQAAHWFDVSKFWPEMKRIVRKKGTVALWGYKDPILIKRPGATRVLNEYAYGTSLDTLGPYWSQPGRSKVQDKLRSLRPPETDWNHIRRLEYEPDPENPMQNKENMFMNKTMDLAEGMHYVRTWSSFSAWQDAHLDQIARDSRGEGDLVDKLFDSMRAVESDWESDPNWKAKNIELEWGSAIILARKL